MLPFLPEIPLPAILLRLVDLAAYAALLLLLLRWAMRGYYMHAYGVWVSALFHSTERICRPLRGLLPSGWFGRRDYVPLVAGGLIVLLKPLLQAALMLLLARHAFHDEALYRQGWALAAFYLSTGTRALCLHAAYLGSALLFLAFLWQQAGRFWRPPAIEVLDDATIPFFRWVAVQFRLRSNWLVLVAGLLVVNLACGVGAAAAGLFARLLVLPIWADLPAGMHGPLRAVAPVVLPALQDALGALLFFLLSPALVILQVILFACIIFVLLSWFSPNPAGLPFRLLVVVAGPPLALARQILPWARVGIIDFSPLLLFLGLHLATGLVLRLLDLASRLGATPA